MIDANRSLIRYRLTQPNTSFIVAETTETEAGPAGTFCAASTPVRPVRKPTSRVINATTDPMSTNLPRANRRSRQATNTMVPSRRQRRFLPSEPASLPPGRSAIGGRLTPRIQLLIDPCNRRPPYAATVMAHSTLTPVFVGLRTGLHVLFAALLTLVVVRLLVVRDDTMWAALALAAGFAVLYVLCRLIPIGGVGVGV